MAVESSPLYPAKKNETKLSLSTGSFSGNAVVWELTSKPALSTLSLGFLVLPGTSTTSLLETPTTTYSTTTTTTTTTRTSLVTAQSIVAASKQYDRFTPDVAGEYAFTAHDFVSFVGIPQYLGDPQGETRQVMLAQQTGTIHVGELMDLPILTDGGEGGVLRLTVVNETIRAAEITGTTGETGRLAALDPGVVAALAALVGIAVSAAGTDLQTGVNELRTKFNAHVISSVWHVAADNVNGIVRAYDTKSQAAAIATLNEARKRFVDHAQQTTTAATRTHTNDDYLSVPVAAQAKDIASATVLYADLSERGYERHRVLDTASTPPIHDSAGGDTTNALSAPSPLTTAIVSYLDAMVIVDPTISSGEPEGAGDLAHRFGFKPAA